MKVKFYILSFCTFAFLFSCQKNPCQQTPIKTYNISSDDTIKIPYKGFDTLTFVRVTTGDTFTFYGTGWQNGLINSTEGTDCAQRVIYKWRRLNFKSPTYSSVIGLYQGTDFNYETCPELNIGFQTTQYNASCFVGNINVKNSVIISNKTFYNVDSFSQTNLSQPPTNFICYYNLQYGVLRMRLPNGEIWELIP